MHPLTYAPRLRRSFKLALGVFVVALVVAPALSALGFIAVNRNVLPHDAVCPSCGGWGATVAVAATAALLIGSIAILVRTIRLPGTAASIMMSALTVVLAVLETLLMIGLYFAIQM